jgi:dienelactone hydrolase
MNHWILAFSAFGGRMKFSLLEIVRTVGAWFLLALAGYSQSSASQLKPILSEEIQSPAVTLFQIKQYLINKAAPPPVPSSVQQWQAEAKRIREHLINDVVFHGWPKDWVSARPRFEDLGVLPAKGYRMRKLRYEIIPGFYSAAILYEPENLGAKVPAILNVNGHVGPPGKAVEYKQKRCINFAKQGMLALNLEWFAFGELAHKDNGHWFGAQLDLVGTHHLGLFYLAMRKGLDYLYEHPDVDRNRLGVTGLSGGGWQTIVLSSLDERVKAAVPVAGYSALAPKVAVRRYGDLGDLEQSATDLLDGQDYSHLTALMAPRPTLLAHNAEDDCCFRAAVVKPLLYEAIRPIYRLFGKEDFLVWHESSDPGDHNYQLDNRLQAYRFFSQHFNLPVVEKEFPVDDEIKSPEELTVGLPTDNLTILGLAKKLSQSISREPVPSAIAERQKWIKAERERLRTLLRFKPVGIRRLWIIAITKSKGVETKSYLFEMENGLSANAVWARAIGKPDNAPVSIVLNDRGKPAAAEDISERINRGEQVLAVDLLLTGDAWTNTNPYSYVQVLHGTGDRALGMVAAQLTTIARWMQSQTGTEKVRLECSGMRNQAASLVACALNADLFSDVVVHEGISSFSYLFEKPVEFRDAPELFCLDLYKHFDFDRLALLAEPVRVAYRKTL